MKGGSLKPQEIRDFLQASYEKDAPMNIDGYVLDTNDFTRAGFLSMFLLWNKQNLKRIHERLQQEDSKK